VRKTKNLKGDTFMFKKLACSTLIGVALTAATAVQAQTAFPAKAIRIVVPFAAGGTSDILARTIGPKINRVLGPARGS
jgi:tripartite-type tricarboxylate transporter receptor subunit TctC